MKPSQSARRQEGLWSTTLRKSMWPATQVWGAHSFCSDPPNQTQMQFHVEWQVAVCGGSPGLDFPGGAGHHSLSLALLSSRCLSLSIGGGGPLQWLGVDTSFTPGKGTLGPIPGRRFQREKGLTQTSVSFSWAWNLRANLQGGTWRYLHSFIQGPQLGNCRDSF